MNTKMSFQEITQMIRSLTPQQKDELALRMGRVPQKILLDMIEYYKGLLKDAERTVGIASHDWAIIQQTLDIMLWSNDVLNTKELFAHQAHDDKLLIEMLMKRCTFYESELMKYTTKQELIHLESAAFFAKVMQKKIINDNPPTDETK